jgi:hypothetical protein
MALDGRPDSARGKRTRAQLAALGAVLDDRRVAERLGAEAVLDA